MEYKKIIYIFFTIIIYLSYNHHLFMEHHPINIMLNTMSSITLSNYYYLLERIHAYVDIKDGLTMNFYVIEI
jgi:hypothetical protein